MKNRYMVTSLLFGTMLFQGCGDISKGDEISTDISLIELREIYYFRKPLFSVDPELQLCAWNNKPGYFLRSVRAICDLKLKDGQVAQAVNARVKFDPPIPTRGMACAWTDISMGSLRYHIDEYGAQQAGCRLEQAESVAREIVTDPFVEIVDMDCAGWFSKTRLSIRNSHPEKIVSSMTLACWSSGTWIQFRGLRRKMAPLDELVPPSSEVWLETDGKECVGDDPPLRPRICEVRATLR